MEVEEEISKDRELEKIRENGKNILRKRRANKKLKYKCPTEEVTIHLGKKKEWKTPGRRKQTVFKIRVVNSFLPVQVVNSFLPVQVVRNEREENKGGKTQKDTNKGEEPQKGKGEVAKQETFYNCV